MKPQGAWPRVACGVAVIALSTAGLLHAQDNAPAPAQATVRAAFGQDCESLLIAAVRQAHREILVAVYSLTRDRLVDALIEAAGHGVSVQVKYDVKQAEYDAMKRAVNRLRDHKIKCTGIRFEDDYAAMHDKFAVIDRQVVLTGSYNFTDVATTVNFENLVRIDSPDIARQYREEFITIRSRTR